MKKTFIFLSVILISVFAQAQFSSGKITAAGLTCAMCTKAIYKSLQKIPFVSKVDADINNSAFNITFKENTVVAPDALKAAVEEAGFSVSSLQLTGNFNNQSIGKDAHVQLNGQTFHFLVSNSKVLNGKQTVKLVDKNFVSAKEFKKYVSASKYPCIETGKASECCVGNGLSGNSRIYHVTI